MYLNLLDYECIREGKSKTNIDKYDNVRSKQGEGLARYSIDIKWCH